MNKNTCTNIKLNKGEMNIYDFGNIKLHAYKTNDFIDDEVFILEKNGKAVLIESPCFFDNNLELTDYLKDVEVEGLLIAKQYTEQGGGKALIDNFSNIFGQAFDSSVHKIDNLISKGPLNIGGIDLVIKTTADAFDVEIPEINAVYTHMLGHDCHSIVAGTAHADALIAELRDYIAKGYSLILTSHYTPEDLKDAEIKIAYLENLKKLAAASANAESFKAEMQKQYPAYSGQNYLDMTAGFFFNN